MEKLARLSVTVFPRTEIFTNCNNDITQYRELFAMKLNSHLPSEPFGRGILPQSNKI